MRREIVVGTRESKLAMWQAHWVVEQLKLLCPEYGYKIAGIRTQGDKLLDVALAKIGDKGLFTKELEIAMQRGEIDMAVHSMKDLPTELPAGLLIGAVCHREDPSDVLVSRNGLSLDELRQGAVIGTSSLRRRAQLLSFRNDFKIVDLRGNVNTRLRRLESEHLDGAVLAYAGLSRMGLNEHITQVIPHDICLPAAGQGSIGIEVPEDDLEIRSVVGKLDHPESRLAIDAERSFLRCLGGGCQIPIGALGRVSEGRLWLEGVVASINGELSIRHTLTEEAGNPEKSGARLAEEMRSLGAADILKNIRQEH